MANGDGVYDTYYGDACLSKSWFSGLTYSTTLAESGTSCFKNAKTAPYDSHDVTLAVSVPEAFLPALQMEAPIHALLHVMITQHLKLLV